MTEMLLIIVNSIHILIYQDFTQTELMRNNCYSNNFGIRRSGATCEHMLFASNWLFISNVRSSEISFSSFLSDWFHWIQKYFNWHQRWTALAEYIRRSDHFMENRRTNVDQAKQSIFYILLNILCSMSFENMSTNIKSMHSFNLLPSISLEHSSIDFFRKRRRESIFLITQEMMLSGESRSIDWLKIILTDQMDNSHCLRCA